MDPPPCLPPHFNVHPSLKLCAQEEMAGTEEKAGIPFLSFFKHLLPEIIVRNGGFEFVFPADSSSASINLERDVMQQPKQKLRREELRDQLHARAPQCLYSFPASAAFSPLRGALPKAIEFIANTKKNRFCQKSVFAIVK